MKFYLKNNKTTVMKAISNVFYVNLNRHISIFNLFTFISYYKVLIITNKLELSFIIPLIRFTETKFCI